MSDKQHQTSKNKPKQKHQNVDSARVRQNQTGVSNELELLNAITSDSTQAQAAHLGDPRLPSAQRQALAAQIGKTQGNQHLQRVVQQMPDRGANQNTVQRGLLDQLFGEETDEAQETIDPEEAALQTFLERGMMPSADGENVIGADGKGGFNAKFDPENRELIATVNIGVNFHHGLNIDETTGAVTANLSGVNAGVDTSQVSALQTAAANVMTDFPDLPDRINEVNTNWRWDSSDETPWMDSYREAVTKAWGGQHYFQSTRWSDLLAGVSMVVNVHKGSADGDHCVANITKTPPGEFGGAKVRRGSRTDATDQELVMSSSGVGSSTTNFLRYSLQFENNSADLNSAVGTMHSADSGPDYLNKFIADFHAGNPTEGDPIQIVGHASATGDPERNQELSDQRAKAVEDHLKTNGLRGSVDRTSRIGEGDTSAGEDPSWRRVDITVGSGEAQITAIHEFGHIIGLGDEYSSPAAGFYPGAGTGSAIGNPAAHDALAQAMGGGVQGAVHENSDSIMSVGNSVRPQHYATFHKALEKVTGENWEYGGSSQGRVLPAVGGPPPDTMTA